jgi:dipeptidyl aminopeptidase/acylaminoacyl peptidase
MTRKWLMITVVLILSSIILYGQKKALDSNVYDGWKSLSSSAISEDGTWITYIINPQQGDGMLYVYNVKTGIKDSVERAGRATFSADQKFLAYQVIPSYDETRQAKKKKLKDDKLPKNSLSIRMLDGSGVETIGRVKSFALAEKNSYWMAYLLEKKAAEKKDIKAVSDTTKGIKPAQSKPKAKIADPKGTELVIYNPVIKKEFRFQDVTDYIVAKDGLSISFLQSIPDTTKIENFIVRVFDTKKETEGIVFEGKGSVKKLSADKPGNLVSFIYSSDTAKVKIFDLWLSAAKQKAIRIAEAGNKSLPINWAVSENGNISFSDDGTRIYFGTAGKPVKETEDTLLDDEKYKLDIWSWDDEVLQPMQKKQLEQDKKQTWMAVYHTDSKLILQLADTVIPSVRTYQKGNSIIGLGSSDLKYLKSSSWEGGSASDYYIVNIETGTKKLLLENCDSRLTLSPSCKYLVYWDNKEMAWTSLTPDGITKKNITSGIKFPLYDELNDMPDFPSPYGIAGWLDDEKHLLIYDRFDIWSVDLSGIEMPVNITNGYGRAHNLRLRYNRLDQEAEFVSKKDLMYLSAFDYNTKEAGFWSLKPGKPADPQKMLFGKSYFPGELSKARKSESLIWQKGSYTESPELYISDMSFNNIRKLSVTNPQQKDYNWGTSELVEWMSFDRQKLQGILYKPEDFDPAKKYPMIVYFYERSSDGLYNYMPPAPSASIINRTFAASNGYLVFVPDIPYKIGYPGESCYNAVMSGTYALLDRFSFIDSTRLGLDGQSWGGYQIAWLVTKTDLFACAYAGAAVSNMISAYGGIRWGTGMSRMFQYEHTQSRIGGTLWEKPVQFIENSPIFFVPKINTPLLLMHNDADDAVPWYQSIEFITALRRLDKPAWLLSYNDEVHNLAKRPNRKDITIRKMQFFDHYLKGAPMPYWMKYGITQLEKGKKDGYELINE